MKEFILNNIDNIVLIVGWIITLISGIITIVKTKDKNILKETVKDSVIDLIKEAENFKNYSGEEKKAYVMTRAKMLANKKLTDIELSELIESLIDLTNNVNILKKGENKKNGK